MKTKLIYALVAFLITVSGLTQVTFHKNYGTNEPENCADFLNGAVCVNSDGGYTFCAGTVGFDAWLQNIYFIRTDEFGDTLFTKVLEGGSGEWANVVNQTPDGGFIIGGWSEYGLYILKTDNEGTPLWNKSFNADPKQTETMSLEITNDNGFIIASKSYTYGGMVIRTDQNGDTLWAKSYDYAPNENGNYTYLNSCMPTSDNGFIAAGAVVIAANNSNRDALLTKLDENGNIEWSKYYGSTEADYARDVQQCIDGGYILCGQTVSFENTFEVFVVKTDPFGELVWSKRYGGSQGEDGYNIELTSDGGYIISGNTYSFNNGFNDIYLLKLDSEGNLEWSRTFGSTGNDYGCGVKQTSDGGYIINGSEINIGAGYADLALIKTDDMGYSNCFESTPATNVVDVTSAIQSGFVSLSVFPGCEIYPAVDFEVISGGTVTTHCETLVNIEEMDNAGLNIYPNPTDGSISLNAWRPIELLQIHSTTGTLIYNSSNVVSDKIDLAFLPSGTYMLSAIIDHQMIHKIVLKN